MKNKELKLFTVGYEGMDIEGFVHFLTKKKVKRIIDVRKDPISRKKGFSKNKLAQALLEKKIEYVHLPNLGVPSAWRKLEKKHFITREKMFQDYAKKIIPLAKEDLEKVRTLFREKNSALLCYEADHTDCHRNYVVKALQRIEKGKIEAVHLESKPQ